MSLYGVSGYPFMDALPRGQSFVNFVQSRSSTPPSSPPQGSAPTPTAVVPTPGGFDDDAKATILSHEETDIGGGTTRVDAEKSLSDGSTSTATRFKHADGTQTVVSERRSMPDAEGYEKIRVREETIDADGTRHVTINVFRVPAGTSLDWKGEAAQKYFLHTASKSLPPGMQWDDVPNNRPPELVADTSERLRDTSPLQNPNGRPVIPLAP